MKKFLLAAIAVFMMAGTTIAAENVVVVNNEVTTTVSENAADKLIALIKSYTNKINAAKTVDELMKVSEQCYTEMMEFQEKNMEEIMALEGILTEEQQAAYEEKLEAVMAEFEAAAEKKAEELMGEFELEDAEF
ncbi:MAG: hypothetical protein IIV04_06525 [Bacteroidaceae bacterium]|nr:hypothetical protein [Bacteroidaceae bacterium]